MTLNKILSMTDEVQPNALPKEVKVQFLNEVEAEVFDDLCKFFPAEEILRTNAEARKYAWTKHKEVSEDEDGKSDVSLPDDADDSSDAGSGDTEEDSNDSSAAGTEGSISEETGETGPDGDSAGSGGDSEDAGSSDTGSTGNDGAGDGASDGTGTGNISDADAGTGTDETPAKKNPNAYVLDDPLNMGRKPYLMETEAVKLVPYDVDEDEAVLLLDDRFAGVYMSYLKAKINYALNELEDYANDAAMYEAEMLSWKTWMVQHHRRIHPKVRGLI